MSARSLTCQAFHVGKGCGNTSISRDTICTSGMDARL